MRIILIARGALAAGLLFAGALVSHAQAIEIDFAKIKWTNMSPKDTATRLAILHVDSISGATQMAYSLPPNTTSPCHWHSASQGTVVAQGSETVMHAGTRGVILGIGGYSFVPARTPFRIRTGSTRTIVLASLDGRFDIHTAPDEQCQSSARPGAGTARAFEIAFANVEWTPFPTKDTGAFIAMLRVDSTSGATHMLFRLPPKATSPCHWHSGSESNFIVQGSAAMQHAGLHEPGALGVGGFSFVPARAAHGISTGAAQTLVFSALDALFDFHPVETSQCQ